MNDLFAITTGILFALGTFQLLRRDLIKVAMGFYILFTAINFLILAVGVYSGTTPAYVQGHHEENATLYLDEDGTLIQASILQNGEEQLARPSDPTVQALLLTAIVISFGSYALLLGMINKASLRFGTINADEVDQLKA